MINVYIYIYAMWNESRQVVRKIMLLSINFFLGSVVSPDLLLLLLGLDSSLSYHSGYVMEYHTKFIMRKRNDYVMTQSARDIEANAVRINLVNYYFLKNSRKLA